TAPPGFQKRVPPSYDRGSLREAANWPRCEASGLAGGHGNLLVLRWFSTASRVSAPCPRNLLVPVLPPFASVPLDRPFRLALGLATEAGRWLAALPPEVGERVGSIAAWAPRDVLYGSRFRRVRATLAATERRPAEDLRAWQDARLAELVALAYER